MENPTCPNCFVKCPVDIHGRCTHCNKPRVDRSTQFNAHVRGPAPNSLVHGALCGCHFCLSLCMERTK